MTAVVVRLLLRVAACASLTWMAWRFGSLTSAVSTVLVWAVALPRPLLDLASDLRHAMRRAQWRDLEGRHYAYHGRPVAVREDIDRERWVRVADVRAVVGFTASDATLQVAYPAAWRRLGRPSEAFLRDDAVVAHLATERSAAALRFRHWVEREIAYPGRRTRQRFGIRRAAPRAAPDG